MSEAIEDSLSNYVTESYLDENNYITDSDLQEYLSYNLENYLMDYVTQSDLSDSLSQYVTSSAFDGYLSEKLGYAFEEFVSNASGSGFVMTSTFADEMGSYLSEYGGAAIYSAISEYLNPSEE